eukprot:CAMPEP_0179986122 /NCGR_PEP_ID=MMETSP0984-20121128/2056_1 /TAXON_ID=483367 /ORGANISM="non described non described, Strain CCMP 2436" /LENGTH=359 /DNA_ID=CAMNT_0021904871 /DNA_START=438 /DNA_END=1513 /DNA_ORIENTATION=+
MIKVVHAGIVKERLGIDVERVLGEQHAHDRPRLRHKPVEPELEERFVVLVRVDSDSGGFPDSSDVGLRVDQGGRTTFWPPGVFHWRSRAVNQAGVQRDDKPARRLERKEALGRNLTRAGLAAAVQEAVSGNGQGDEDGAELETVNVRHDLEDELGSDVKDDAQTIRAHLGTVPFRHEPRRHDQDQLVCAVVLLDVAVDDRRRRGHHVEHALVCRAKPGLSARDAEEAHTDDDGHERKRQRCQPAHICRYAKHLVVQRLHRRALRAAEGPAYSVRRGGLEGHLAPMRERVRVGQGAVAGRGFALRLLPGQAAQARDEHTVCERGADTDCDKRHRRSRWRHGREVESPEGNDCLGVARTVA